MNKARAEKSCTLPNFCFKRIDQSSQRQSVQIQGDMGEALDMVYPATTLQTCIVHLIRNSLDYASWKDRKPLAAAIKPIYTAPTAEAALVELDAFESGPWGKKLVLSR